jgi:hypothetical protein
VQSVSAVISPGERTLQELASELLRSNNKLKYKSTMEYLNLSNNRLGDQGVAAVAETLASCRSIRDVDLADCGATVTAAAAVGNLLSNNKTLLRLNVSGNAMGSQGAALMAEGLRNHPTLRTLVLCNMGLGDVGTGHVTLALQENISVQLLDLSRNHVGPAGAALCRTGLQLRKAYGHMERVELGYNPIGQLGAKRILQAVTAGLVDTVGLEGCSFAAVGYALGSRGVVNEMNPEGRYELSLFDPLDFQMMAELVELRKLHGDKSWTGTQLNGKGFTMTDDMGWPDQASRKPTDKLTLTFVQAPTVLHHGGAMAADEFERMWAAVAGAQQRDEWRIGWCKMLASAVFLTCSQVATLLKAFEWGPERLEATQVLFGRLVDPQNQREILNVLSRDSQVRALHTHTHTPSPCLALWTHLGLAELHHRVNRRR